MLPTNLCHSYQVCLLVHGTGWPCSFHNADPSSVLLVVLFPMLPCSKIERDNIWVLLHHHKHKICWKKKTSRCSAYISGDDSFLADCFGLAGLAHFPCSQQWCWCFVPAKPLYELSVGWGCTDILFAEIQDAYKAVRKYTLRDAISFKSSKFLRSYSLKHQNRGQIPLLNCNYQVSLTEV